jgi:thioredoxin reductase (NADPH)
MEKLVAMTDKLSLKVLKEHQEQDTPCVKLYREDNTYTGLAFHGVPGGHEFTSFVLGIYNAAGPGQTMDEGVKKRIQDLKHPVDIKILVTLSCSMCPDLVIAAQHLAAISDKITTEVYDVRHFESLGKKYNVMSVPCMVINDEHVLFGKKNMLQVLEHIEDSSYR